MYKELYEAGLSERESKVYLALIELGNTTAGPLVKKSEVPQCKIYETLNKLIKKGLVSYTIKSKTKHFQASDPEALLDFIDEKRKRISNIIPILKNKQTNIQKQESTIYEGLKGIKTAIGNILNELKKGDEYYVFSLGEELKTDELRIFFKNFHAKRREKKIKVKLIAKKELRKTYSKHYKTQGLQIRYSSQTYPTGIFIFNKKVMTIVIENNPSAFIIQSEENTKRYKKFFENMWKIAKP